MAAAELAYPSARPAHHYRVPDYVPAVVRPVLPWTRHHVARVTARYQASRADLWDEALTARIRAAVYFKPQDPTAYRSSRYAQPLPAHKSFRYYAQLAVHRALALCDRWPSDPGPHRAPRAGRHGTARTPPLVRCLSAALLAPSAEDEAIARDAARRSWILREHAELAAARGDNDTTSRLSAAASAADRVARRPRRPSSASSR